MLRELPDAGIQVFAVWEPILPTDWMKPTSDVLSRMSDSRVRQFWDRRHVLATRLAHDARDPQPKHECCERNGHLWDLVAVYPPRANWNQTLPTAIVFDGPVVRVRSQILRALTLP